MKKILIILILITTYGFSPAPEKCSGVVTVSLVYSWTDTAYLYVKLDNEGGEKKVRFIGKTVPQINERITFNCKQIIN
jgi:hypothetical protein